MLPCAREILPSAREILPSAEETFRKCVLPQRQFLNPWLDKALSNPAPEYCLDDVTGTIVVSSP